MTIDKEQLKALAIAFPEGLDFDSNTEPFFNGPSGESLGGGSTGFYSVYGQPFEIEGEQYDGTEYVSICTKEFAEFICSARDGVLALLDEVERLERKNANQVESIREYQDLAAGGDRLGCLRADLRVTTGERDQFKAENEALQERLDLLGDENTALLDRIERVEAESGSLRKDSARLTWLDESKEVDSVGLTLCCGKHRATLREAIDAAMAMEARHG